MCKKTFLGFPKQKTGRTRNQDMVRTQGETPFRQQQCGLDTATQELTDPLLSCHWFCCSYFHKLGTKASSCQRIWMRNFLWVTFLCWLGVLPASFGMGSLSTLIDNNKNTNWNFCLASYIILQPLTTFIKVSLWSLALYFWS